MRASVFALCALALTAPVLADDAAVAIPQRGVVEGFYGRPWSHEGRLGLLKLMGEVGLNTYVYGPKDDPYHHAKWRESYPEDRVAQFRELLAGAKAAGVEIVWAIHLGDAFKDESDEGKSAEYAALFRKLEAMYAIGFRSFAAFFDDFGGATAALHAEISNRIQDDFLAKKGDCADLVICPHDYWGDGSSDYCKTLGEKCGPRIRIMWTGPDICSDIPADTAKKVAASYRREPFVWWNWPVNDFHRAKLVMGPMYGVDPHPFAGFVINPMENLEASKIAVCCTADYARDPAAFDSAASFESALKRLYGEELAPAMKVFCDYNADPAKGPRWHEGFQGGWTRRESERLAADGDLEKACLEIRSATRLLTEMLPIARPELWAEIKHWVETLDLQAVEGLAAIEGNRAVYEVAKRQCVRIFEEQKAYFADLAPEWDKRNCTGCCTGAAVLQPLIDAAAKKSFGEK